MPNLSIKDVPEAWAQALRERAARNHRSLQGELMALVQGAVAPEARPDIDVDDSKSSATDRITRAPAEVAPDQEARRGAVVDRDRFGRPIVRQVWKTVEQVVAELKAKYPQGPLPGQSSSIDMIRKDRDHR